MRNFGGAEFFSAAAAEPKNSAAKAAAEFLNLSKRKIATQLSNE